MSFRSKWWTIDEKKKVVEHSATYRKPVIEGEVKGKKALKAAKRERVAAMKAANHPKGDNKPFAR